MTTRYYANGPAHALSAAVADSSTTSIQVDSVSGWPTQFPFTIIIDKDGILEEICDVTDVLGTTLTIVRGADSSLASAHAAGVSVVHGVSAREFRESNTHINSTENVHGTTGSLVDTDSSQTIPGAKEFTGGLSTAGGNVVDDASDQTIGGIKNFVNRPTTSSEGDIVTEGGANFFTGANNFSVGQFTVNSAADFNGTEDHSGAETHTGTESHSNTETHTGNETHSGTVRLSNSVHQYAIAQDNVNVENNSTNTFSAGAHPLGLTFVAPPSGAVFVTVSSFFEQSINDHAAYVGFAVRAGGTLGSGTVVLASSSRRALLASGTVTTGTPVRAEGSRRYPVSGLTPGSTYNVQCEFATDSGGGCTVNMREILVEPVL